MPPRDEQDYANRRQQIIDGALNVFAKKGFEKATNKDIADAARIGSPGLIYHYFKDKGDLFQQVLQERLPVFNLLAHAEEMMDLPPRVALTRVGDVFVQMLENRAAVAMLKLIIGEAVRRPELTQLINTIGPARGLAMLTRYLERQMDAGRLRRTDPGAAARCFIGPLVAYVVTREVFVQPDIQRIKPEDMARIAVDVFLKGMEQDAPAAES